MPTEFNCKHQVCVAPHCMCPRQVIETHYKYEVLWINDEDYLVIEVHTPISEEVMRRIESKFKSVIGDNVILIPAY